MSTPKLNPNPELLLLQQIGHLQATQQHKGVAVDGNVANPLAEIYHAAALDVEDAQALVVAVGLVVYVGHLQALGRQIEHSTDGPFLPAPPPISILSSAWCD